MKRIFVSCMILLFCLNSNLQAQVISKQLCLGGSKYDEVFTNSSESFRLKDGSKIFFGTTNSPISVFGATRDTFGDLIAFKIDKDGVIRWTKNIGLTGLEFDYYDGISLNNDSSSLYISSILFDSDSIAIGNIQVTALRKRILRKMDLDGNISWSNTFYTDIYHKTDTTGADPFMGYSYGLVVDNVGNCLITHSLPNKANVNQTYEDTLVYTLVSGAGATLWQKKYSDGLLKNSSDLHTDIRFLGDRFVTTNYGYQSLTFKTINHSISQATGATIKDTILYSSFSNTNSQTLSLPNNTFLLLGYDSLICLDKNLNILYKQKNIVGVQASSPQYAVTPDDALLLNYFGSFDSLSILKYNYHTGTAIWQKFLQNNFEVIGILNNYIYGIGRTFSSSTGYSASTIYKLDLNGNLINQRKLDSVFNTASGYKDTKKDYSPVAFYSNRDYNITPYNIVNNNLMFIIETYDTILGKTLYGIGAFDANLNTVAERFPPSNFVDIFREVHANNMFLTTTNNLVFIRNSEPSENFCNLGDLDITVFGFTNLSNTILGKTYIDNNNNNIYNAGTDFLFTQGYVKSAKNIINALSYLDENGQYNNLVDTGSYNTIFTGYNNYYTVNPVSKNTTHTTYGNIDTTDFALHPKGNIKDLRVTLVNNWVTRPGFTNSYDAEYTNEGTTVVNNASVAVVLDNRLIYNSAVPSPASIVGDTLKWNLSALNQSQQGTIKINFTGKTPPTLNGNDSLLSKVWIYPIANDTTPVDNQYTLTDIARSSFDPNDKDIESNAALTPAQVAAGDFITYRVRFQNTGNYVASNVIILDTLENNLDWSSLQIIASSHTGLETSLQSNNIVTFKFNNINLPASSVNDAASHGYVVFKIKPKNTLVAGNTIKNTAHITFDFNTPVGTSTAVARVVTVTATTNKYNTIGELNLFPNPNNGNFTVDFSSKGNFPINISLFDMTGKIVYQTSLQHSDKSFIRISDALLPSGLYNIQVSSDKDVWNRKVIIVK